MKIARLRQPALTALAVLLLSGAGIAFAGNSSAGQRAVAAPVTVQAAAPAAAAAAQPAAEPFEPAGADTDTLQQGDQTTPDTAAESSAETEKAGAETEKAGAETEKAGAETEKAGAETEKAGAEEPGDANLPGGGHADDPNDANADHQFEGVE